MQLLIEVLPFVSEENCFALKGGMAINMFVRDMPRLSVDIDLMHLLIEKGGVRIKIKASPVMRGTVREVSLRIVSSNVEEEFGFVETPVVHPDDLYAGKLCATLDRQHPRDFFDVRGLLDNEGISDDLMNVFIVYLISSNQPIAKVLSPSTGHTCFDGL